MGLSLFQRRLSAWLVLLAMWLGALAPVATQAMAAHGERAGWVQICSVSGMTWVQVDAGQDGSTPNTSTNGCTWCVAHASGGLLPSALVWAVVTASHSVPPASPASAVLARAWGPWQSRAPPVFS